MKTRLSKLVGWSDAKIAAAAGKKRVKGLHYFGEHRARTSRGRWEKVYVVRSLHWRGIAFRLDERSRVNGAPLRRRVRGKGHRPMMRRLRRCVIGALGALGAMFVLRRWSR